MAKPQIFNRDMKRLAYLDNALAVGYGLETNSLWTATFTLPADDPKNAYCTPLNFVEIFDGDERIDLFRIIGEDMERSNGATRYYDCEHVLATLLSDVLFQYHQCGGSGVKTADVLNYILARQTRQNWKLGACDFKRYFEYNWENSTLLAALFAVPECFDSEYLWSWDTTVYPWTLSLTAPTEALKSEIRYAKNMTNIKKTTDATSIDRVGERRRSIRRGRFKHRAIRLVFDYPRRLAVSSGGKPQGIRRADTRRAQGAVCEL